MDSVAQLQQRSLRWRLAQSLGERYRWLIWFTLALVAFTGLIQMFAYSVLIPSLLEELQLSYALAGTLASAYMLSLAASMVPVGALGDRFGGRYLLIAGQVSMILGAALFALADNYLLALASRVFVGAGAASSLVLSPVMLAFWFNKQQYRTVVGLQVSAGKVGSVVAMWLLPPLVVWLGWRLGYAVISLFGPLALLVTILVLANKPADVGLVDSHSFAVPTSGAKQEAAKPEHGAVWRLIRGRNVVLLSVAQFFVFANYFGMVGWLPTYLSETVALSEVEAGFQTGFILWGTIIGYAMSGPLANRVGRCAPVYAGGAALAAMLTTVFATGALLALPTWSWPALMLVYGLSVSIMVLMVPILAAFVPIQALGTLGGVVGMLGYLGAMVSPPAIGAVADYSGSLSLAFWVAVACAAIGFVASVFIREGAPEARAGQQRPDQRPSL